MRVFSSLNLLKYWRRIVRTMRMSKERLIIVQQQVRGKNSSGLRPASRIITTDIQHHPTPSPSHKSLH